MQLSKPLLALVSLKLGPILEMLIKHSQSLLVILWQADFLPELLGQVGPFNGLHVKVAVTLVFKHCCVAGVG